jgi:hypothetical protein
MSLFQGLTAMKRLTSKRQTLLQTVDPIPTREAFATVMSIWPFQHPWTELHLSEVCHRTLGIRPTIRADTEKQVTRHCEKLLLKSFPAGNFYINKRSLASYKKSFPWQSPITVNLIDRAYIDETQIMVYTQQQLWDVHMRLIKAYGGVKV